MSKIAVAEDFKKQARNYKKHLKDLTINVGRCLKAIDETMRMPESKDRGSRIAKICNALEMANDRARYFGLNIDYRTDKK
jgi:hypothetical protein